MSDNLIAKLEEDILKTEPAVEETTSQSEPQLQNTDMGTSHQDEASEATSAAEHQQPEPPEPSGTSKTNRKQLDRFGEPIPTNLLQKEGGCDSFKGNSRNLDFLLKFKEQKKNLPDELYCSVDK